MKKTRLNVDWFWKGMGVSDEDKGGKPQMMEWVWVMRAQTKNDGMGKTQARDNDFWGGNGHYNADTSERDKEFCPSQPHHTHTHTHHTARCHVLMTRKFPHAMLMMWSTRAPSVRHINLCTQRLGLVVHCLQAVFELGFLRRKKNLWTYKQNKIKCAT